MSATTEAAPSASSSTNATQLDALIIGAGIAGMYQLYRRREQGLSVRGLEAGDNLGGTWYWNRYPGARVDSQSHVYQYWFSRELNDEWNWSERFPGHPEVERYLNHVADRFDLRKDIQFNTRVTRQATTKQPSAGPFSDAVCAFLEQAHLIFSGRFAGILCWTWSMTACERLREGSRAILDVALASDEASYILDCRQAGRGAQALHS
jgi:phytoene dehydrogenase-like protein